MKKQKNYYKKLWIILFFMLGLGIATVYASNAGKELVHSIATSVGIGQGKVEFTPSGTSGTNFATYYKNKGGNSSIIGNYFTGYYYDSTYGFFKLNWDLDGSPKNVRIVDSTNKCSGYGYKLGGYAYNENFGFIDFSYNDDYFVYYCSNDKKLHGYAYLENVGFQNFEGIDLEIVSQIDSETGVIKSDEFANDTTEIKNPYFENKDDVIQGNIQHIKDTDGSVFYIIK